MALGVVVVLLVTFGGLATAAVGSILTARSSEPRLPAQDSAMISVELPGVTVIRWETRSARRLGEPFRRG